MVAMADLMNFLFEKWAKPNLNWLAWHLGEEMMWQAVQS